MAGNRKTKFVFRQGLFQGADFDDDGNGVITADPLRSDMDAADLAEQNRAVGIEGNIQSELNDTQQGAGLAASGNYVAVGARNFIGGASSLDNADGVLDGALKSEETARGVADGNIQSELDVTQTGAGLDATGTYTADPSANFIMAAPSLKAAGLILDAVAFNALEAGVATQNELLRHHAAVGLDVSGNYHAAANAASNYLVAASSFKDADLKLDAQAKINDDRIADLESGATPTAMLQGSFNNLADMLGNVANGFPQTEADAVIGHAYYLKDTDDLFVIIPETDGELIPTAGVNGYPAGQTWVAKSLCAFGDLSGIQGLIMDEVNRAVGIEGNIQSELNDTQSGAGLAASGNYVAVGARNFIGGAVSLDNADDVLDGALKSEETARGVADGNIQSELDVTQTGAGLAASGIYVQDPSANFINASVSLAVADADLDVALKVEEVARELADTTETTQRSAADTAIRADFGARRIEGGPGVADAGHFQIGGAGADDLGGDLVASMDHFRARLRVYRNGILQRPAPQSVGVDGIGDTLPSPLADVAGNPQFDLNVVGQEGDYAVGLDASNNASVLFNGKLEGNVESFIVIW